MINTQIISIPHDCHLKSDDEEVGPKRHAVSCNSVFFAYLAKNKLLLYKDLTGISQMAHYATNYDKFKSVIFLMKGNL